MLRTSYSDKVSGLSKEQINTLMTASSSLRIDHHNDFSIDAYKVFNCYIQIFPDKIHM
jgi:hypothetical protein